MQNRLVIGDGVMEKFVCCLKPGDRLVDGVEVKAILYNPGFVGVVLVTSAATEQHLYDDLVTVEATS